MTEHEIEAMKRNIEAQLTEYAQAINDAKSWYQKWQLRQRAKGFRCVQENQNLRGG